MPASRGPSATAGLLVCVNHVQNYPLFLKTVSSEKDMTFYYTVYTSLDVVEEKISSIAKSNNDLRELYLGLLYPMEDYKVYPFVNFFVRQTASQRQGFENRFRDKFQPSIRSCFETCSLHAVCA